jgi:two-component sensor histidine kinase
VAEAVADGVQRIYAFKHLEGHPLVAMFGAPTAAVWRDWAARTVPVFAFLALMGLFAFLAADRIRRDLLMRFEVVENRKRVAEAERLAEERIRLMRETNHRVKNNLALVVSLINMQMRGQGGIDGAELKTRIGAISHVHDLMYQAADAVHVDIGGLLRDIATSPALVPRERGLAVDCEIESGILLGPDRTTPLALIVAELVTNAVKHAFRDGRRGTIRVALRREGDEASLTVADDGVGLPHGAERRSGSAIVEALVEQIGASLTLGMGPGASFNLRFRTD